MVAGSPSHIARKTGFSERVTGIHGQMVTSGRIPLLAADPELERLLGPEERLLADQITLPVQEIAAGPVSLPAALDGPGAFAALVLDGILLQTARLGEHTGLRLVGPGELLALRGSMPTALILDASLRATVPTQLALFGDEFLYAARRLPRLMAGLHDRSSDQSDRTLAQMLICQLPRVDDRLLSMLWLVAETWGRVTASGTVVPVRLTHAVLGGLIGARRSTVTLALKELTERGAVLRQAEGWLLLEPPSSGSRSRAEPPIAGQPRRLGPPAVQWGAEPSGRDQVTAPPSVPDPSAELSEELRATIERLRAEHRESSARLQVRLSTLAQSRERLAANRRRISAERAARQRVPSS
jgi:CRP/FNR family cyclic AMP-dependent transcriptional regulator